MLQEPYVQHPHTNAARLPPEWSKQARRGWELWCPAPVLTGRFIGEKCDP